MKEAERVARIYQRFYTITILLISLIRIGKEPPVMELREFKKLGKKVQAINKKYLAN